MNTCRMMLGMCCLAAIVLVAEREAGSQGRSQDPQVSEATLLSRIAAQHEDPAAYLDLAKLYYRE